MHKLWNDSNIKDSLKSETDKIIAHLHGGFIPEFFHLQATLKRLHIPFVVTPHGNYNLKSIENRALKKRTYFNLFEKQMIKNSKIVHCLGKSEKNALDTILPKTNAVVIPNGFSNKEIKFEKMEIEVPNVPIFGFCGRMDKKMKGLDLLLQGFAKFIHQDGNSAKLWLIGGGYQIAELKQMASDLDILNDVVFFGPRYNDEKLNILNACTAFYHPSRYEGIPMSILEAAALGLPCIVSDATNMAEYIKENNAGLILEPNNIVQIYYSMSEVSKWFYDKAKLNRVGINAQMMVEKTFNWESIAGKLVEAYAA